MFTCFSCKTNSAINQRLNTSKSVFYGSIEARYRSISTFDRWRWMESSLIIGTYKVKYEIQISRFLKILFEPFSAGMFKWLNRTLPSIQFFQRLEYFRMPNEWFYQQKISNAKTISFSIFRLQLSIFDIPSKKIWN